MIDMNKTLEMWERMQKSGRATRAGQKQNSNKKNNAAYDVQKSTQTETIRAQMIDWLNRYGVVDKDKTLDKQREKNHHSVSTLKQMKEDAKIDLHGDTSDEAWKRLEIFVDKCVAAGYKKILIVHGKGNHCKDSESVLAGIVKKFIEYDSRLGMSGHPDNRNGGTGATWVIIKG